MYFESPADCVPHHAAALSNGIVFTVPSSRQVFYIENNQRKVDCLQGMGSKVKKTNLYSLLASDSPLGITVEFGSVVYVTDAQYDRIVMLTQLKETSKYLSSIGSLYKAFSIHKKNSIYENQSLDRAIELRVNILAKCDPPGGGINSTWKNREEIQLEKNYYKLSRFLRFVDIFPVFDEFLPYFPFQL